MAATTDQILQIIDWVTEIVEKPELRPSDDGVTHCNQAVSIFAMRMGYQGFTNLTANRIVEVMEKADDWVLIPIEDAQGHANDGRLVIAGERSVPHGHVCIVRPGLASPAGFWGRMAPKVANVGGRNFVGKGLNYAFKQMPRIWVWKGKEPVV